MEKTARLKEKLNRNQSDPSESIPMKDLKPILAMEERVNALTIAAQKNLSTFYRIAESF
jgi:hypothetical protein